MLIGDDLFLLRLRPMVSKFVYTEIHRALTFMMYSSSNIPGCALLQPQVLSRGTVPYSYCGALAALCLDFFRRR